MGNQNNGVADVNEEITATTSAGQGTPQQEQGVSQEEGKPEQPSVEALLAEREQLRKEAAKYRTERNELRTRAEEKSKTSATEAERITALEQKLIETNRKAVAAETGLPIELVAGDSEEQMRDSANAITELINARVAAELEKQQANTPVMPVVSGENAGGTPTNESDWLRSAFQSR